MTTGSLVEPLQIHLPVTPTITTSFSTTAAIKSENISSGSSSSSSPSTSLKTPTSSNKRSPKNLKQNNKNINECILNLHQQHQSKGESEVVNKNDGTGCSRTLPLAWNTAVQHLQTNVSNNVHDTATTSTATLLQIKREPCQVSEVTTSNNLLSTTSFTSGAPAIIKIEQKSPTITTSSASNLSSIASSSMETLSQNCSMQQNNGKLKSMKRLWIFLTNFKLLI